MSVEELEFGVEVLGIRARVYSLEGTRVRI